MKKLYIKTYGCQMNFYDSGRMGDMLLANGFTQGEDMSDADLVILNTCHIREKAAEKMYSDLGRIRKVKDRRKAEGKYTVIAVAGCVAQAEGKEIIRRAPCVDIVVGPQAYQRLPAMVANAEKAHVKQGKADVVTLDFAAKDKFDLLPEESTPQGASAFLTIQEGCDKFCTFCVVPYTRGAEFSRPVSDVYREAEKLVAQGAREITLLGQNVNAYHGVAQDGNVFGLGKLIHHLADISGLERLRYTTSHPRDMDEELIAAHRDVDILMPFLHLPVQSGSDKVLEEMNRKHKADEYRRVIDALREARPDIAFSSDFIVGFPGETREEFEATMQLVRDVNYAQAYSFKYSPRAGTPAATREDSVPEEEKSERLAELQALINAQQVAYNQTMVGRTMPVLFERQGKTDTQIVGRSPYMHAVHVEGNASHLGRCVDVRIDGAHPNSLSGTIVEKTAENFPLKSYA